MEKKIKNELVKFVGEKESYTLEDIMIVFQKLGKGVVFGGHNHSFYLKTQNKIVWTGLNWQPNKPFREQSDETKNFIGDLILKIINK